MVMACVGVVAGSHDGKVWDTIKAHDNDTGLTGAWSTATWLLDFNENVPKGYQMFRSRLSDILAHHLPCSNHVTPPHQPAHQILRTPSNMHTCTHCCITPMVWLSPHQPPLPLPSSDLFSSDRPPPL